MCRQQLVKGLGFRSALHDVTEQLDPEPGYGFVILVRLAMMRREVLDAVPNRVEGRVRADSGDLEPHHAQMVAMMEFCQCRVAKAGFEFFVVQDATSINVAVTRSNPRNSSGVTRSRTDWSIQ